MLAYDFPLMGTFLSFLSICLMVIWIWIAVMVFIDIFRSHDLSGWSKALWLLFVIVLPYLGVFVYLVARGGSMHERQAESAARSQQAFQQYVQETAGVDNVDQLQKLAGLRDSGVLTDEEFAAQKAKLLA